MSALMFAALVIIAIIAVGGLVALLCWRLDSGNFYQQTQDE